MGITEYYNQSEGAMPNYRWRFAFANMQRNAAIFIDLFFQGKPVCVLMYEYIIADLVGLETEICKKNTVYLHKKNELLNK